MRSRRGGYCPFENKISLCWERRVAADVDPYGVCADLRDVEGTVPYGCVRSRFAINTATHHQSKF